MSSSTAMENWSASLTGLPDFFTIRFGVDMMKPKKRVKKFQKKESQLYLLENEMKPVSKPRRVAICSLFALFLLYVDPFCHSVLSNEKPPLYKDDFSSSSEAPPGDDLMVLPKPWSVNSGSGKVCLNMEQLEISGSVQKVQSEISQAVMRFKSSITAHVTRPAQASCIRNLIFSISSDSTELFLGVNEAYDLVVNSTGVFLSSETIYGAYHALETLSQLTRFEITDQSVYIPKTPIHISDKPRFQHRELLIDSARHFLTVNSMKQVLDSMAYAKLNTVHWHIADDQSFSYCNLRWNPKCESTYSREEFYTRDDLLYIVEYARLRGIRMVPEIDIPGHTGSICRIFPASCTADTGFIDRRYISPAHSETLPMLKDLLEDIASIFPDSLFHLGGDEVNLSVWDNDTETAAWMKANNKTSHDVYMTFIEEAQRIVLDLGKRPVGWDEIWTTFGTKLDKRTIIHAWRNSYSLAPLLDAGYSLIFSVNSFWYLDYLGNDWKLMYNANPCNALSDSQCSKILGGGGEMWGESVDPSDILQTIWPRAAAIAERLWSDYKTTAVADAAATRMAFFRCLLLRRGVPSAPLNNKIAREGPPGSGSCLEQ